MRRLSPNDRKLDVADDARAREHVATCGTDWLQRVAETAAGHVAREQAACEP